MLQSRSPSFFFSCGPSPPPISRCYQPATVKNLACTCAAGPRRTPRQKKHSSSREATARDPRASSKNNNAIITIKKEQSPSPNHDHATKNARPTSPTATKNGSTFLWFITRRDVGKNLFSQLTICSCSLKRLLVVVRSSEIFREWRKLNVKKDEEFHRCCCVKFAEGDRCSSPF